MSTNIAIILGRKEDKGNLLYRTAYKNKVLYLTRFSGGNKGMMLQITLDEDYIQLTEKQIEKLKAVLIDWKSLPEID